jgi:hypothetical protein
MIITVNPALAKLPFSRFKEWHKKFLSYDPMTAEERYKELGGKVPEKKKTK